jgi:hypothetical protein
MNKNESLREKLVRVEYIINVYKKNIEEPIQEIQLNNITIDKIKQIVTLSQDDPLMYDGYELNATQLNELSNVSAIKIIPDFVMNSYVLESVGIYNW